VRGSYTVTLAAPGQQNRECDAEDNEDDDESNTLNHEPTRQTPTIFNLTTSHLNTKAILGGDI
jgi:hypothetical protein